MNLYKLHKSPKSLDYHEDAHDAVAHLFWDKYRYDPGELKKREKALAFSTKYAYKYARDVLHGRFKLGEPAIATNAQNSCYYAQFILKGPFKLGEPAIATNPSYSFIYAKNVLKGPFKLGEPIINKDKDIVKKYDEFLSSLK